MLALSNKIFLLGAAITANQPCGTQASTSTARPLAFIPSTITSMRRAHQHGLLNRIENKFNPCPEPIDKGVLFAKKRFEEEGCADESREKNSFENQMGKQKNLKKVQLSDENLPIEEEFKHIHKPTGLTLAQSATRMIIKNVLYHHIALNTAINALFGKQTPYVNFMVNNNVPAIFVNFKVEPDKLKQLHQDLALPESIHFMPVAVAEGEEQAHLITLNAYHVNGITQGLRAEWSTYIDRGDGKPSYLMIKTDTDMMSMDPVDIITEPVESFDYTNNSTHWHLYLDTPEGKIGLSFQNISQSQENEVYPDRNWVGANDYVYWLKYLICDRVYCDGSTFAEPMEKLNVTISSNQSHPMQLLDYTDGQAYSAYALKKKANFVVAPWYNLNTAKLLEKDFLNKIFEAIKTDILKLIR